MSNRRGFSIFELALVLALLALILTVSWRPISAARDRAYVRAARVSLVALHAQARQTARHYGRVARLHIEPHGGDIWITVDTSVLPRTGSRLDTIGELVDLGTRFGGASIVANTRTICFEPRGLGTAAGSCPLANSTIEIHRGLAAETLSVSRLGNLRARSE